MSIKFRRESGREPYREDVNDLIQQCRNNEIVDDVTEEEIATAFDCGNEVSFNSLQIILGSNCFETDAVSPPSENQGYGVGMCQTRQRISQRRDCKIRQLV